MTIHLFEDPGDHIAALDWYTIDRTAGRGEIDLTGLQAGRRLDEKGRQELVPLCKGGHPLFFLFEKI